MKFDKKQKSERLPMSQHEASRLGRWVLVALAIHAVILLATSVGFIKERWISPPPPVAAPPASAATPAPSASPAVTTAAPGTDAAAAATPAAGSAAGPGDPADPAAGDPRLQTKAVKKLTEAAKPGEIPKKPDELGLSLEDTNHK